MPAPFRIKVCGIRRLDDVQACVDAGVDAIGLNLYPPSVRYVEPNSQIATQLSHSARDAGLLRFGVFVNETVDHMVKVADQLSLDGIQLHGDESVDVAQRMAREVRWVLRAVRVPQQATPEKIQRLIEPWLGATFTLLLDADAGSEFGGSGKTLYWQDLPRFPGWVLAGGLTPDNVSAAIAQSGATSVDVASGVESPRGVKNANLIKDFAAATRDGWADSAS